MLVAMILPLVGIVGNVAHACGSYGGGIHGRTTSEVPLGESTLAINGIPYSTRAHWMRQANLALNAPCPFAAFGSVIVNHTSDSALGELVCTGANSNSVTGNPTLHGEPCSDTVSNGGRRRPGHVLMNSQERWQP